MTFEDLKSKTYHAIRQTEKYTQTDMVYLTKGGFWLTSGQIISSVTSFLMSLAFANLLPKEVFGQYRYVLSIFSLLAIPALQGMNNAIVLSVAKGFDGVLKLGFKTKLKWSALGSLASLGLAIYFWLQNDVGFTISFLLVAVCLPLMKGSEVYQSYLVGKKLFGQKMSYTTLVQILASVALAGALFLTDNLVVLIAVYFFTHTILQTFFLFLIIKRVPPNAQIDPAAVTFGKHLSLLGVLATATEQLDKILLFYILGPIQVAIYSFAILPIEQIRSPLQHLQDLAFPKLSVRTGEEITANLPKKLLKASLLILAAIAAYIFIVPYFFKIFYPQYVDSIFYSQLFAFHLLVFPISMMALSLQAKMSTKDLYKMSISNQIIFLTLLLIMVLVLKLGIFGVVLAKLLALIPYFFIAWFYFKKLKNRGNI